MRTQRLGEADRRRMMERLTHPRTSGIKTGYWSPNKKDELIEKLAEYEDTGLTPQEIYLMKSGTILKSIWAQWIPVEERLPENHYKLVLVQVSGSPNENISLSDAFELATYNPDDGWILENYPEWEDANPVAWRPLPEPYKMK